MLSKKLMFAILAVLILYDQRSIIIALAIMKWFQSENPKKMSHGSDQSENREPHEENVENKAKNGANSRDTESLALPRGKIKYGGKLNCDDELMKAENSQKGKGLCKFTVQNLHLSDCRKVIAQWILCVN